MRFRTGPLAARCIFTCLFSFVFSISAVTLDELRNTTDLTPQKFASFFSDFEFKFHAEIQAPEVFLATQSGDCDDYAILAATVLKEFVSRTRFPRESLKEGM